MKTLNSAPFLIHTLSTLLAPRKIDCGFKFLRNVYETIYAANKNTEVIFVARK